MDHTALPVREEDTSSKEKQRTHFIKHKVIRVFDEIETRRWNWEEMIGYMVLEDKVYVTLMAGKTILLETKDRKTYTVEPIQALETAKAWRAYHTGFDGTKFLIIPEFICQKVHVQKKKKKIIWKKQRTNLLHEAHLALA